MRHANQLIIQSISHSQPIHKSIFFFFLIAFDRTHTFYVAFHSRGFYVVMRVLIVDARSFQDRHLGLTDTRVFDLMPNTMNLNHLKLLYCEFHKYEVMTMSVVDGQPKKKKQIPVKKH